MYYRFLIISLLSTLVGTTLPFWLDPPNFYFKWYEASLFLCLTFLCYTGFFMLFKYFKDNSNSNNRSKHLLTGIILLISSILIGLYLNNLLKLNKYVFEYIFLIYSVSILFVGILYVIPPFNFYKRIGGEVILSVGLGLTPLIGAYLIQAGDLTRSVYLAAMPLVISIGLMIWIKELINIDDNKQSGYSNMVMIFPPFIASRIIPILIICLLYLSIIMAVFGRSSISPISLISFVSLVIAFKIILIIRRDYISLIMMKKAYKYSFIIYLVISITIIITSLY